MPGEEPTAHAWQSCYFRLNSERSLYLEQVRPMAAPKLAAAVLGMATQAGTACAQRAANASSALGAQLAPPSPAGCSFAAPTNNRSSGTCRLAR